MINTLPGYLLNECIYEGANTFIYRALRKSDFSTVILKTTKAEYPTLDEVTRLRHEYKTLKILSEVKGVIRAYALEDYQNSFALILEDFHGFSFKQITDVENSSLLLMSFLTFAIQLADTLHGVHQKHIIHKDINPQNILLDPETCTVKLIDFSIASRLLRENPTAGNPEQMEGTLAYMSPEATGRMNRVVDYRTDFYSLGVTFYEMLAGQLPFTSTDPLELVHCHIAKNPVPLHQVFPDIPQPISDIVMKLMAKNAEDRYQSALGLKVDLETCLDQLYIGDRITNFRLGKLDRSGRFLIPQKLYGRTTEVERLLEAFDRVNTGTTEMMLVSGYSGIGKTSVINEIHKPIVRQRGYFITGKFDQFKQNIPYAALLQAFQGMIQQILTESTEQIAVWQAKLLAALAQNGQIIIDAIPELEYIIGAQPAVPQLGTTESQNRFQRVFQQFINVFAQQQHPLVLFLDDLQWADLASLKLIESVMCDPDSKYLLLIGAYRNNEVSPMHPTIIAIDRIKSCLVVVTNIVLQALEFDHVCELISDTLGANVTPARQEIPNAVAVEILAEKMRKLTQLVYHKTQGNPFFINQLLQTLYRDRLLEFDFKVGQWNWDLNKIQAMGIIEYDVVELIARNIQKLPASTQHVLKLAACLGHYFSLDNLAIVNEKSLVDTAEALWIALQSGFILPLSQAYKIPLFVDELEFELLQLEDVKISYKFLHDRVQQAAYSLIPEAEKQSTHLQIGRLLLQRTTEADANNPDIAIEESIFDIVNQLNIGIDLITSTERQQLARLNLIAGKRAKAATAYDSALRYVNLGIELLPENSWITDYQLSLNLYTEAVEIEYLNGHYIQLQTLSDFVLQQAKTPLDKVKAYETKIQFHIAQNQMLEAIATALEILEMLGVSLPEQPSKLGIFVNSLSTKLNLGNKRIEDLSKLPIMTDPEKIAAMRILIVVLVPAFLTTPNLFPVVTFKMVNLSLRYGNSPQAAYGYALYGWLLCGALGDINSGYQFGQLAIELLEKFNAKDLNCKVVNIYNAFIRHWKEHGRTTIPTFVEALQMSLATGNIEYAGYSSINFCHYTFLMGEHLENVKSSQKPYVELMHKLKQEYVLHSINTARQTVLNLLGESADPRLLVGKSFNETELLPVFQAANVMTSLFMTYFYKTMLLYLFKEYDAAVESAELAEKYTASIFGFMTLANHNFYYSLSLLGQYAHFSHKVTKGKAIAQKQVLKLVESNQKKMKEWAKHAPENYQHKYDLVEAEKARCFDNFAKAEEYYDRAIKGAASAGYTQELALANELAAEFYFADNRNSTAEVYLIQSYYGYVRWGAKSKTEDLVTRYPEFFRRLLPQEEPNLQLEITNNSKTSTSSTALDAIAIAKALETIANEVVFERLISKFVNLAIESSGATKGVLFLLKNGNLQLAITQEFGTEASWRSSEVNSENSDFPTSLINYIARTKERVAIDNVTIEKLFANEPYIVDTQPKSVCGLPLFHRKQFIGILYLENNLTEAAFSERCLVVLQILAEGTAMCLAQNAWDAAPVSR